MRAADALTPSRPSPARSVGEGRGEARHAEKPPSSSPRSSSSSWRSSASPSLANLGYGLTRFTFASSMAPVLGRPRQLRRPRSRDPAFWAALGFSLRFAVAATLTEVLLGLVLALALEPLLARHRWLMAFLLLPMMVSPALLGVMWRLLLNEFVGIVPAYLDQLGLSANLLGPEWVVTTLVLIEVLQWTPFAFLILFTGLQAIPAELLEAARIDGAGAWQRLRRVVLPLLLPAIGIAAGVRFIDGFRVFDHIYVLTGGGPGTLTTSASIHVYKSFFQTDELGRAVAEAMLLFARLAAPRPARHPPHAQGQPPVSRLGHALRWALFVVVALVLNFPILATALTSLKTTADINASPPVWLFAPTLEHYRTVLTDPSLDFPRYLLNSTVMAALGTLFAVLLTPAGRLRRRPPAHRRPVAAPGRRLLARRPARGVRDPALPALPGGGPARHAPRPRLHRLPDRPADRPSSCSPAGCASCRSSSRRPPASTAPGRSASCATSSCRWPARR